MHTHEQPNLSALTSRSSKLPLHITSLDDDYWIDHNPERKRLVADGYEIIWLLKGAGWFKLDLESIELSNQIILFIKPGQPYTFPKTSNLHGYIIHISSSNFDVATSELDSNWQRYRLQLFSHQHKLNLLPEHTEDLRDVILKMLKECSQCNNMTPDILKRYLSIFFLYLSRQVEQDASPTNATRNDQVVQQFMRLLEQQYKTKKMVADYAQALSLSPNYLNEIVKKCTGFPAGYHIRQRIVLEAKRMLFYTDTCRKEIAYNLGFNDMAHFSKFFKATTGKNFTDFKKEKSIFSLSAKVAV